MSDEKDKILYLHGRPSAHPVHQGLARTITDDFAYIDEPEKWQENRSNFIVIFICWVINAFYLRRKDYKYFLIDNLHITPIIYKVLFPSRSKHQKFIVHLGSHTLYFMYTKQFGALNLWIHKWALSKYDALICEGKMSSEFAKSILGEKCPPIHTTFIGPLDERLKALKKLQPDLNTKHLLIIASGPSSFRFFYKGMDLMLKAFNDLYRKDSDVKLTVMGNWDINMIRKRLDPAVEIGKEIFLVPTVTDLDKYCELISQSSLCIQVARGDAFPTATLEAMAAGLPCLVSEYTGTKQVVEQVDAKFICKLDVNSIVESISWYFSGSEEARKEQGSKFKAAVSEYTESNAQAFYKQTFEKIKAELKA
jgi:glycosyltransferase involved in cell wall biosynthesis